MRPYDPRAMKIKTTTTPPVEQRHGVTKNREFTVLAASNSREGAFWVPSDDPGETVLLLAHEYEVTDDSGRDELPAVDQAGANELRGRAGAA